MPPWTNSLSLLFLLSCETQISWDTHLMKRKHMLGNQWIFSENWAAQCKAMRKEGGFEKTRFLSARDPNVHGVLCQTQMCSTLGLLYSSSSHRLKRCHPLVGVKGKGSALKMPTMHCSRYYVQYVLYVQWRAKAPPPAGLWRILRFGEQNSLHHWPVEIQLRILKLAPDKIEIYLWKLNDGD